MGLFAEKDFFCVEGESINHEDMEAGRMRRLSQIPKLLHKPYLVEWSPKGLWMSPDYPLEYRGYL